MNPIKIRYTCVKKLTTFSQVFTMEEIEHGHAAYWMRVNLTSSGEVHRDLWTGAFDEKEKEVFGGDEIFVQYRESFLHGEVKWLDSGWKIVFNSATMVPPIYLFQARTFEITGNIHINTINHDYPR
jgi:hypothetical protein